MKGSLKLKLGRALMENSTTSYTILSIWKKWTFNFLSTKDQDVHSSSYTDQMARKSDSGGPVGTEHYSTNVQYSTFGSSSYGSRKNS